VLIADLVIAFVGAVGGKQQLGKTDSRLGKGRHTAVSQGY
jgi:hypothetical protein